MRRGIGAGERRSDGAMKWDTAGRLHVRAVVHILVVHTELICLFWREVHEIVRMRGTKLWGVGEIVRGGSDGGEGGEGGEGDGR